MAPGLSIGEVAERTGLTQRTLRYYEDLGLLAPARSAGGRREYDERSLARLYRIRLLRSLGTPVAALAPDDADLLALARRHLADLDDRIAAAARERERVRAVEARLVGGGQPSDAVLLELLDLLAGLGDEPAAVRRLTLLVYRDPEAVHRWLGETWGFGAGPLTRGADGRVHHAELSVGDGLLWLHEESPPARLASPATSGTASHCMAVAVDDVDDHHRRSVARGVEVAYPPTDMPYGVREYGARDPEGGLWSFQQERTGEEQDEQ